MRWRATCTLLGLVLALAPGAAPAVERFVILQDVVHDGDAPLRRQDDFLDTSFLVAWKQAHAQLTLGSFATGLEVGGYRHDARGSTYGAAFRRRQGGFVTDTSLDLETQQKFRRVVLAGLVRFFWPDHPETENLLAVPQAAAEVYYRDECFASVRVVHDPRPDTGTTFRFANRLGTRRVHVELAVAPRTDGVINWSVAGRWGLFLLGFGRERDFDFTRLDRQVVTFGFHYDFEP